MPLPTVQRADPIVQSSWSSGVITTLPPEELPEDAAAMIENFEFDDVANLVSRVPTVSFVTAFTGQQNGISSIFLAKYSNGTSRYYYTAGSQLYRMDTDGNNRTNITGAFTFTTDRRWYWVMFDDFAIGVQSDVNENPIKIDSAGTVTILNASAPPASYCEVWNNRLWLVGVGANQNTIFGSAINDPEDWTVDDDSGAIVLGIDINDGDFIVGIKEFRGNLFVYKENKINVVSAISAPATIPSNLRVDIYSKNIGCIAGASIQNVLDDQVYLSYSGIMSLSLTPLGNTESALLSRNIAELGRLNKFNLNHRTATVIGPIGFVLQQKRQYWISISGLFFTDLTNRVWVMDYSDIAQKDEEGFPKIRWCKFTGSVYGTSYEVSDVSAGGDYFIGASAVGGVDTPILKYSPVTGSSNFTGTVSKRLLTRAFGISTLRSLWHRFAVSLIKLTTNVTFITNYYYDNYIVSKAGDYTHTLTGTPANNNRTIWKSFKKNDSGRKANLVQIEITANTADQGFTIKSIHIDNTRLNFRRATNKWNSD